MALKRILDTIKWFALFLFAILILSAAPIAFLYNVVRLFWKTKIGNAIDRFNGEFRTVCYTLDVLGNVTVFNWFDHFIDRHPYGKSAESVSEVLYYRNLENKLSKIDTLIYKGILKLDPPHFEIFEK